MSDAHRIVIRIKKGKDGRTALSCLRGDGSTTWQRQEGGQAAFFPRHDLTHYAVESTLGLRQGFFGLVAEGWNFSDFGSPWRRGPLPIEAVISELIVGFLDSERITDERRPVEEINERIAERYVENDLPARLPISEEELEKVRQRRGELFVRWDAVKPGDALEISFERS